MQKISVLGALIDVITWEMALSKIHAWSVAKESRYVCICNSHSVVTSGEDVEFNQVINNADMATPDGAPVAWMMRRFGCKSQQRINGPDLMWRYCKAASERHESIYLYGSSAATLEALKVRLAKEFPELKIAGAEAPPFRPLSYEEDIAAVARINQSGAGTVWVSLGCPKQEKWMAAHRGHVRAVMIGVGAAFDYHAGTIRRAPLWMQSSGLEWLYRLLSEPRRLWKRYFRTNSLFVLHALRQLVVHRTKS